LRFIRLPAAALAAGLAGPALAACPIELATYADGDSVAAVEFTPVVESAAVTNRFRMLVGEGLVYDGIVMWTEAPERPFAQLTHQCPDGDVTGAEIEACTVWEGPVYSLDKGTLGLMPVEGKPAPEQLLFAGLGHDVVRHASYRAAGLDAVPWDLFSMSGCQE